MNQRIKTLIERAKSEENTPKLSKQENRARVLANNLREEVYFPRAKAKTLKIEKVSDKAVRNLSRSLKRNIEFLDEITLNKEKQKDLLRLSPEEFLEKYKRD